MADQLRVPGNLCIPEVGWWMILRDFGENLMFRVFEWRSELQVLLSASTQKAVKAQVKFSSTFIISPPPPLPHFDTTGEFEKKYSRSSDFRASRRSARSVPVTVSRRCPQLRCRATSGHAGTAVEHVGDLCARRSREFSCPGGRNQIPFTHILKAV